MPDTSRQEPSAVDGARHLLLFDGECGLCDRTVQLVLRHDRARGFDFAALQSAQAGAILRSLGVTSINLDTLFVIANYNTPSPTALTRAAAVLFLARHLGWPYRAAAIARVLPWRLLDALYDRVAASRYRVFGRLQECRVPSPDTRARFLDWSRQ